MRKNQRGIVVMTTGMTFFGLPALTWADGPEHVFMPGMMWGGWGMLFGPLTMIAFVAILVVVLVLIVRWLGGAAITTTSRSPGLAVRTPLDILKERFARGEIDKDEFEEKRRLLSD